MGATLRHDAYPERRAAAWHGTLTAVNRHDRPIDTLFVQLPPTAARPQNAYTAAANTGLVFDSLEFIAAGVAHGRTRPPRASGSIASPSRWRRGTRCSSGSRRAIEPRGFPNDGFNNDVAVNGSFMNNGYVPELRLQSARVNWADDDIRERNGLKPKPQDEVDRRSRRRGGTTTSRTTPTG